MMKSLVLNSTPTIGLHLDHEISKESSFPPLPSSTLTGFMSGSRNRKTEPIFKQVHPKQNFVALPSESKQVSELLEIPESKNEPELEKAYDHLLETKKKNQDHFKLETDRAFEEAAKLYFQNKEDRRTPPNNQSPKSISPPPVAPDAETVTPAAVLATAIKRISSKPKRAAAFSRNTKAKNVSTTVRQRKNAVPKKKKVASNKHKRPLHSHMNAS